MWYSCPRFPRKWPSWNYFAIRKQRRSSCYTKLWNFNFGASNCCSWWHRCFLYQLYFYGKCHCNLVWAGRYWLTSFYVLLNVLAFDRWLDKTQTSFYRNNWCLGDIDSPGKVCWSLRKRTWRDSFFGGKREGFRRNRFFSSFRCYFLLLSRISLNF